MCDGGEIGVQIVGYLSVGHRIASCPVGIDSDILV